MSRPETVFQLTAPDLPVEFPALAAATSVPGNLPSPPTSFMGRVDETKRLAAELPTHRLVTLVGPGGVGKTRLSIEAAAAVVDDYLDGVWFVELAPVTDTDAVVHAVASTLSVSPEAGVTLLESIVDSLSGRRVLVFVDNCEHVIDAAAEIAAAVSIGAPNVTILATSREPLAVAGEKVVDVVSLEPLVDAVELFVERAGSVVDGFAPSDADVELIRSICGRLDGMPLAIELAASRVRSISLAQLADRLEDRFRLLRSSVRGGAVERHQTLRATVEWSYRLLTGDEQVLFDRLSVFGGGFDLDAAEAVCGFEPIEEFDVFDLLSSLVDKSLVVVDRDTGRYRLLETLRQYGTERLDERAEVDPVRARYVGHYLEVAGRAREWFEGTRNHGGRELFELEWDNLRAALDHAETLCEHDVANSMLRQCWWYSLAMGRNEHHGWAERRLASSGADPFSVGVGGWWAYFTGDFAQADELGRRSIALAERPDDPECALGWYDVTSAAWYEGRHEDALAAHRKARQAADPDEAFNVLIRSWPHPAVALAPDEASALIAEAHERVDPLGNDTLDGFVEWFEYCVAFGLGDHNRALAALQRQAELGRRTHSPILEGVALSMLAARSHFLGDDDPTDQFRTCLWRLSEAGYWGALYFALSGLAHWWTTSGHLEQAAYVVGFLDRHDPVGNQIVADLRTHAKETLDAHPPVASLLVEGAALTRDEIVTYCFDHLDPSA